MPPDDQPITISRELLEKAIHALEITMYAIGHGEDQDEVTEAYDELRALQGEHTDLEDQ